MAGLRSSSNASSNNGTALLRNSLEVVADSLACSASPDVDAVVQARFGCVNQAKSVSLKIWSRLLLLSALSSLGFQLMVLNSAFDTSGAIPSNSLDSSGSMLAR